MSVTIRYFNHFGDLTPAIVARLDEVVRETAAYVRGTASDNAPVDTGALRQSMYIAGDEGTDWGPRANEAESLRHSGNRPNSPAQIVGPVLPNRAHQAIVGSAVAHGIYNELGTSKMPARPFLVPSVEGAAREFYRKVQEALDGTYRSKPDVQFGTTATVEDVPTGGDADSAVAIAAV